MSAKALAALLLFPVAAPADHVNEAWSAACSILADRHGLSCADIAPPEVELRADPESALGEYVGGDLIYIDTELDGINRDWILVHEMTHYIFSVLRVFPLPNQVVIACQSEAVAFDASNAYLGSRGYGEEAKEDWLNAYPQCSRYFASTFNTEKPAG